MYGWTAFFVGLSLAVCVLAFKAYDGDRFHLRGIRQASILLLGLCVYSNAMYYFVRPYMTMYMAADMLAILLLLFQTRESHVRVWFLTLIGLFMTDIGAHAILLRQPEITEVDVLTYNVFINVVFIAQLACVAIPCIVSLSKRKSLYAPI